MAYYISRKKCGKCQLTNYFYKAYGRNVINRLDMIFFSLFIKVKSFKWFTIKYDGYKG